MDEQHPSARGVDLRTLIVEGAPPAREPFDPALLLEGRRPPPLPYASGPAVARVEPFDPATHLGERALRGAFNLPTGKPVAATIGGVEVVTIPLEHYAALIAPGAGLYAEAERMRLAAEDAPTLDAEGMLRLLLSLHATDILSTGQLIAATGLGHVDIAKRITDYAAERTGAAPVRFVASPEAARVDLVSHSEPAEAPEAHGAALDAGKATEAHGAALDNTKPEKRSRAPRPTREVPSDPV